MLVVLAFFSKAAPSCGSPFQPTTVFLSLFHPNQRTKYLYSPPRNATFEAQTGMKYFFAEYFCTFEEIKKQGQ